MLGFEQLSNRDLLASNVLADVIPHLNEPVAGRRVIDCEGYTYQSDSLLVHFNPKEFTIDKSVDWGNGTASQDANVIHLGATSGTPKKD